MPSIQDVADQTNAKLDTVITNTGNTATNTASTKTAVDQVKTAVNQVKTAVDQVNSSVNALDSHVQSGFVNLSQGLFALLQVQKAALALADHNRKQNDTIICLLENSNELLCGITRKLTRQLELSDAIRVDVERIEAIEERVHPGEAADFDRSLEMIDKIERCCPPERPKPEQCPEPCSTSDFRPIPPQGQDWKPLPAPKEGKLDQPRPKG